LQGSRTRSEVRSDRGSPRPPAEAAAVFARELGQRPLLSQLQRPLLASIGRLDKDVRPPLPLELWVTSILFSLSPFSLSPAATITTAVTATSTTYQQVTQSTMSLPPEKRAREIQRDQPSMFAVASTQEDVHTPHTYTHCLLLFLLLAAPFFPFDWPLSSPATFLFAV